MILVTGASGQLGSLVLRRLAEGGADVTAGSRTTGEGERHVDFDDPRTLDFSGVDTLVLVSAGRGDDDVVVERYANAIRAAVRDGVGQVVYTSVTTAGEHLAHAVSHRATERLLQASGLAWTVLRNGLYAELLGGMLAWADGDTIESPLGEGRLAAVPRADLAEAAAVVASSPVTYAGRSLDLVGRPVSVARLATELGVTLRTISLGEFRRRLEQRQGMLPVQREMALSIAGNIRHGFLVLPGGDLG